MSESPYLIYGAYGYTGALTARLAVARGHRPILAGRRAEALASLAAELGLPTRTFALDDPAVVAGQLQGVRAVLHCAGPFARTAATMADACIRAGVHYLDVTGEPEVFQAMETRDAAALAANVMVMPGTGFDVVPSDCLAAYLKSRLPGATHLTLGIDAGGNMSRGTSLTVLEGLTQPGLIRRDGVLTPVPAAYRTRSIDFGSGPTTAVSIPWGDLVTAFRSTGIPNIEVYAAAPFGRRFGLRAMRYLGGLLAWGPVRRFLQRRILAGPPGPTDAERASGVSRLWGEATDAHGGRVAARLRCPEAYTLTALTALEIVDRVLNGAAPPGYQTPATA